MERKLTAALLAWSAASVTVGTGLALVGKRNQRAELMSFGRQTAAWGAVDALIAGAGALSRRRRGHLSDEEATKKVRSLRSLLLINAVADAGYIAGGAVVFARGRTGATTLRMSAGDGLAIVVQGAFLLILDVSQVPRRSVLVEHGP